MDRTQWRPVVNYEGRYEVSNDGQVRSVGRSVIKSNGVTANYKGRVLALNTAHGTYRGVTLWGQDGAQTSHLVHVLVATAFLTRGPGDVLVRHRNGDELDNRAANLAWGTHSDNAYDTVEHGRHHATTRTHCPHGHRLEAPNLRNLPKGWRGCKSCKSAEDYVRRHGGDVRAEADRRYKKVMSA